MRKTYGKNFLRTVKGTFGRFAAIFAIVALGVGFLAGLMSSTPDIRYSFDKYFNKNSMYDLRVMGDLGITDGDIDTLRSIEGVETVQAGYIADVLLSSKKDVDYTARLHSFDPDGDLNRPELTSGRYAESPDECVVVNVPLSRQKLNIGDILTVSANDKNAISLLNSKQYKIVGFADYCPYFSAEKEFTKIGSGTVDIFLLLSNDSFKADCYTDVYITMKDAGNFTCLTDGYKTLADSAASKIKAISYAQSRLRYNQVINDANEKLSEANTKYNNAKAETDDKLSAAEKKLNTAEKQIADGEEQLSAAKKQLDENEITLNDNEETLNDKEDDLKAQLEDAEEKLNSTQIEIDGKRETVKSSLAAAETELKSYGLNKTQQAAFNEIRKMPLAYPSATSDLSALQSKSARLKEIAARLSKITSMNYEYQVKYAGEVAGLTTEQAALQTEIAKITSGEAYKAFVWGATKLALTGVSDEAMSALALKLGSLDEAQTKLDGGQTELNNRRAELATQKTSVEKKVADARTKIENGKAELAAAKDKYKAELSKLSSAKAILFENKQKYEDTKSEVESKLLDGEKQIFDAKNTISDIELPSWHVYTRENNVSYISISANIDKVNSIAKVFPFFFFLVAALVALTTMTRMVEDDRLQIGTMKALGYSRNAIMGKYILYALMASVLGSIVGIAVGLRLFPSVIWNAYTMMYELPRFYYPVNWAFVLGTSGSAILCVILATWSACRSTLKERPAQLMLVKSPEPGKRVLLEHITPIWKRMKFTHKVTARNLFRYKKRFLMTTIGVAGCTALLMAGFGLRDSFSDIADRQFGVLHAYDIMAPYESEKDIDNPKLQALLKDGNSFSSSTIVSYEAVSALKDGKSLEIYTFIPEKASDLNGFINLRERVSGHTLSFDDGSVVITEKLSEVLNLKVGDKLAIASKDGNKGAFTISGICENYLRNYIYMTESTYRKVMGRGANQNLLLIRLTDNDLTSGTQIGRNLLATGAIGGLSYTSNTKDAFAQALSKVDTIVAVVILSAGALAFVVLYNLTNINISERVKEIATIKVLGFTDREVNAYINRESVVLALLGTAFGLVLGIFLHRYVVSSAEMDIMMFGRTIRILSYVFSAALTMTFSMIVNIIMGRKLQKISMVESMKAPE